MSEKLGFSSVTAAREIGESDGKEGFLRVYAAAVREAGEALQLRPCRV